MMGKEETSAISVSFQPKAKEMMRQPIMLNNPMEARAVLVPRSCWSWVGSLAREATRVPVEFSLSSKKDMGLWRMLSKYSCLYE